MRIKALTAICGLMLLTACSTVQPSPVGIGSGTHELKGSPCACTEIPMEKSYDFSDLG